jgi:hypothetical protein
LFLIEIENIAGAPPFDRSIVRNDIDLPSCVVARHLYRLMEPKCERTGSSQPGLFIYMPQQGNCTGKGVALPATCSMSLRL